MKGRSGKSRGAMARRGAWARNPVVAAIAKRRIDASLQSMQINLYMLADGGNGHDELEALASLAWYIGLGAQVSALLDVHSPVTRRLHGALRTVQGMCLDGYRWHASFAPVLDAALIEAKQVLVAHPDTAQPWLGIAEAWRQRVLQRHVQPGDVAGAEFYRQGATQQLPAATGVA